MKHKFLWVLIPIISVFAGMANASVIMTGTRIIFPSSVMEKTIQLKNPDDKPYIVQMQMTDENDKPDKTSPFSLIPPIFRIEPDSGQSVRLIFTGKEFPQDKESVFYLDFTQLPALKKSQKEQNQLIIAIRSRVTVFYRPVSLEGTQSNAYQELSFSIVNGKFSVENPTGFYIPVREAKLSISGKSIKIAEGVMLSPKSTTLWSLPKKIKTLSGSQLQLILVNDYGVDINKEITL